MRKFFAGLAALFVLPAALHAQNVVVMQWNIHGNLGLASQNTGSAAKALARIVNYHQPDLILINELTSDSVANNQAALTGWVTNNLPYMGTQPGVSFFVAVSSQTDGFNRNASISRYPILNETTFNDGLRGLHSFQLQLTGTNRLQVFHAHLKCCADDCTRKQTEAQFDANTVSAWAAANSIPYIFAGDWNEDESNPECTLTGTYHPITTIRETGQLVEFKPTTLDGEFRTWSTGSSTPSIRFDYILAASNRLAAVDGLVFSSRDWALHGFYTNAGPQNLVSDSATASDHYCVLAGYFFPTGTTGGVLNVTPANGLAAAGNQGGPFNPASITYTLSNTGSAGFNWLASATQPWLTLSAMGGWLLPGDSTVVTASINSVANSLAPGNYSGTVSFINTNFNAGNTTRPVSLTINQSGRPSAPANLVATAVSRSQINLTWTDTSGNENGFRIQRSTNGTNFTLIATVGANVTSFNNTNLPANRLFFYRVRTFNSAGSSTFSNTASARTLRN